jgi:hypothetical protein
MAGSISTASTCCAPDRQGRLDVEAAARAHDQHPVAPARDLIGEEVLHGSSQRMFSAVTVPGV